jgi:Flp pilus assembly CpaE family ATPase
MGDELAERRPYEATLALLMSRLSVMSIPRAALLSWLRYSPRRTIASSRDGQHMASGSE